MPIRLKTNSESSMDRIFTVNLPDIGEGVVEGEVIEWLKQPNDSVSQDEPVVIVMTDKATVELPSPYPGKIAKHYFKQGEIAIRDKPLYDVEVQEGIDIPLKETREIPPQAIREAKQAKTQPEAPVRSFGKALAAPSTRKMAKELGIDLSQISGTGPNGIVLKEDLAKHEKGSSTPILHLPDDEEEPLIGIRNLMAKRMSESKKMAPHFSYFEQVDATRLVQLRHSFKEEAAKQGISVTYMPFIIRALSLSMLLYPMVNSSVDQEKNQIILHKQHNVGLAIATPLGLIVPVLKNVQAMTLQELIVAYEELKHRAMEGKLLSSDMKDSTITVSNFGVLGGGGLWATPIINYPEVAILGIGRIHKQPLVRNGAIVVRDALNLSWSFDHRVIDGDLAANFSHHVSTLLQNPAPLL